MKFEKTASFQGDYGRLSQNERELFKQAFQAMNAAARDHQGPGPIQWPAKLRIGLLTSTPGIYEMTWSFSGPDGRATFEFVNIEGEMGVRWRRVGGHAVFNNP